MPSPFSNDQEMEAFLQEPRLAMLMSNRANNAPIGVPVWFEWTGKEVLMFAASDSLKLKRLKSDPRVSVLVTNHIGEPEAWVAFDGTIEIGGDGASDLIGRMGPRYWDLSDPVKQETLDLWMSAGEAISLLRLSPSRVRSGA